MICVGLLTIVGALPLISACSIENPMNGKVLPSPGQYCGNSTVTFKCNSGYSLRGSKSSFCRCCQWDPEPPTCEINTCEDITPANAFVRFNGTRYQGNFTAGMTVRFVCNEGHSLYPRLPFRGVKNICQPDGTWRDAPRLCIPDNIARCKKPTTSNGRFVEYLGGIPREYLGGITTVHLRCNFGYKPFSDVSTECTECGEWYPSVPNCTMENTCEDITPTNGFARVDGRRHQGNFFANMRARFICNDGYMLYPKIPFNGIDNDCLPNGTWKSAPAICIPDNATVCEIPATNNGRFLPSLPVYFANTTVSLTCNTGYVPVSDVNTTCDNCGEWDPSLPNCTVVQCNDPTPRHGTLNVTRQTFVYQDTVELSCNDGFFLDRGSNITTCKASGKWRPKRGRCLKNEKVMAG